MKMITPGDYVSRFTEDAGGRMKKYKGGGAKESKDLIQG